MLIFHLLLAGCGLEPVYPHQSPAAADGTFIWVAASATPPPGYELVTFAPPDGAAPLSPCVAILSIPGQERGPHPGLVVQAVDIATPSCWVGDRGQTLRFSDYQQLWAHEGATYRWDVTDNKRGPLSASAYFRNNRVALDPVRNIASGEALIIWHPCAASYAGHWYLGKVSMGDNIYFSCEIALGDRSQGVRDAAELLYAPVP